MADHIWTGVFPAVTTQFRKDLSLDLEASSLSQLIQPIRNQFIGSLIKFSTILESTLDFLQIQQI